ncbi:SRPBCC family protein [Sideroxydans lithotrophicus]|uniref:Polyketide cyclase/dehydrase n=1 Tax=Sideroxydans lithotrophicus (strain ES-1) TaxID=580332 RepID=D5CLW1_SIDLE|nr:SRPBCC family protein [Sideroxydans lithotrophicus]ADE12556.1 Polyketide cyclase/dehydrase [Sideroxydans lithotrophicus ES-1]
MLKVILLVAVVLVGIVLIYAAMRPDELQVERNIDIQAKSEKVFNLINDFHRWQEWTPYNKDPAMQKNYSGSASGQGAKYAWEGDKNVGKGEISITSSTPLKEITLDLHMIQPFEGRNVVVFSLNEAQGVTHVTWSMMCKQSFVPKLLGLFMDMDKMIGGDFEQGLSNLKTVAEKQG